MKSDFAAKPMSDECPSPSPDPNIPPAANANSDWASCPGPWPASIDANGCSQSSTRLLTCGSRDPTAYAPAAASSRPSAIQPVRPVATYSMITKSPKNSSEVPRSRSSTSTPTLVSHTATTGASTRPGGSRVPRRPRPRRRASTEPFAARYAAKNTASRIFANSPGWKDRPPTRTQIRAPFTAGKKIGRMSRASAAATDTYAYRRSSRWSRRHTTTTANSATPSADQTSCVGAARSAGVSRSRR